MTRRSALAFAALSALLAATLLTGSSAAAEQPRPVPEPAVGAASVEASAAEPGAEFTGVTPVRVADTRDGSGVRAGKVAAGQTLSVAVAGAYGVPADARAVSLNVTVTQPGGPGFATVYPCGEDRPVASNLNFAPRQTVPNAVVVKPGAGGAVCLYTMTTTHFVVDLNGYFPSSAVYEGIVPIRAADTRNGTGVAKAKVAAGQTLEVAVAGQHGIPGDAHSVATNVTVTEPRSGGHVTVWPCGQPRPLASNLNFTAGQTVPNAVIAGVGANGSVCLYTTAAAHLIVDVGGYYHGQADYWPQVPSRVFDTRKDWDRTKLDAGWVIPLEVAGPGEATAVALNVTVTQPVGSGYITVYPCNEGLPLASNLNYVRGQTVPNLVIAPVDSDGNVCFYTSATTHILADANGVWTEPDRHAPNPVQRLRETANLDGHVTLEWTNPPDQDLAGVFVRRAVGDTPPGPDEGDEVALEDPAATTVNDTGLIVGTSYTYAVYAYDWSGNVSPAASLTVAPRTAFQAQAAATGTTHGCAVHVDGSAWCWGEGGQGQLGNGTNESGGPEPSPVVSDKEWIDIGAGVSHTCAVTSAGTVECWGSDRYGQLGDGGGSNGGPSHGKLPVQALDLTGIAQVVAGGEGACALDEVGQAWCWGARMWPHAPTRVGGGHAFVAIDTGGARDGYSHACGLDDEGRAWCWGDNYYDQLGNGIEKLTSADSQVRMDEPTEVAGDHRFISISTGVSHTCAVDTEGATWCWGDNIWGALGNGGSGGRQNSPVRVATMPPASEVVAGLRIACALTDGGRVWCWGLDAPNSGLNLPTPVAADLTFDEVQAGDSAVCGIRGEDELWCGLRSDKPRQVTYAPIL